MAGKRSSFEPWKRRLLDAYRQGSLQQRLVEVKSQYQGQIKSASLSNATKHAASNATEHAAERPATEPTHVVLECSRSKITIEQATATARATTKF